MTIKQELHRIIGYDSPEQVAKLQLLLEKVYYAGANSQSEYCAKAYRDGCDKHDRDLEGLISHIMPDEFNINAQL